MPVRVGLLLASLLLVVPLGAATPADAGMLLALTAVAALGTLLALTVTVPRTVTLPARTGSDGPAGPRVRLLDPDDDGRPRPRAPGGTSPAR